MPAATPPTEPQPVGLRTAGRRRSALVAGIAASVLLLASCGSGAHAEEPSGSASRSPAVPLASPQCAGTVATALGVIAKHVYHELSGGRIARPAVERVAGSTALIAAAEAHDPAAARAAIAPLLRNQLVRVRVIVAGRTLLDYGTANAVAPVSAPLQNAGGRTIGEVIGSEQGVLGYSDTVHTISGAQVFVRTNAHALGRPSNAHDLGGSSNIRALGGSSNTAPASIPSAGEMVWNGTRYAVYSFAGLGFPKIPLRTYVLAPVPPASACASKAAETAADAIGGAAERIYRDEQSGAQTRAVVRDFESSRAFQEAVSSDNRPATEAAIVAFFKSTLHVVRVRATLGERLVADVGGPHVLAPIRGDVRDPYGHVVGHFLLSVQDDLGYVILAHRFAGLQVFLSQGGLPLAVGQGGLGDTGPVPADLPARGEVTYKGLPYHTYSFTAEAFPKGPLQVQLLIPPVRGA
ncbi:MAG: hypothetical protein WBV85_11445 [Solirubrobacteraceae bacterium]